MRLTRPLVLAAGAALTATLSACGSSRPATPAVALSASITSCYNTNDPQGGHTHADFAITNGSDHQISVTSIVVTIDGAPIKGTTLPSSADLNAGFAAGVFIVSAQHPITLNPGDSFNGSQPGYHFGASPTTATCSISVS